jgi:hypothetical protein
MKLLKLLSPTLLLMMVLLAGCKERSPKDLIVNRWRVTEMSGPLAAEFTDSSKQKIYATAIMEFKKDGQFQTTGLSSGTKTGTYSVTGDGKQLISTNTGDTKADTLNILEISTSNLVVEDTRGHLRVSFKSR